MRLQFVPFLWFFFALSGGIIAADYFHIEIYFSWAFLIILFFTLIGFQFFRPAQDSVLQKIQFVFPILLFFQLGQLLYQFEMPENNFFSVQKNYLPGDAIVGEISAISKTSGDYKKCEVSCKNIIRYKDTIPVKGKILVFLEDPAGKVRRKDICKMQADLSAINNNNNPGEFDSRKYWKHKSIERSAFVTADNYFVIGRSAWEIMDLFVGLREKFSQILDLHLSGDENAVAKGLILGDRSSIDSEITRKFGNTGAMHVLAVSGLHVAILVQILTFFFGLFTKWISRNQALILALLIVWIYAALTGLSASVVRSALMFTILAGSTLSGRNYNAFNSLAFSAMLILIWNPHFLFDIGFQLSYLAMVGIFLFNKHLSVLFYSKYKWIRAAWEGTMVGIAAQIMTVPLTLYYFHQFPNYFILTNLGLMVFSFLVLALGIALFAVFWINPLAKLVALALTFSLFLMLWIIDFVDSLPGAVSSGFVLQSWEVLLVFALILLFFYTLIRAKIKIMYAILSVSLIWIGFLVNNRFSRMQQSEICFFQAKEPTFIVKDGTNSFCFFGNKKSNPKKAKYLAEAYSKVYPAGIHYFEISNNKQTNVNFNKQRIAIERQKGGYEILVGKSKYFYATSDEHRSEISEIIYAPWLAERDAKFQLSQGSISFDLHR